MALPAGRAPSSAAATQVRRNQPPSGCGARSRAAISDSPGRTPSGGTETEGAGHGEGVRGGAAEERTIRGGPLDEEMAVVLPGEADATEGLDGLATDEALAVVGGGLGHETAVARSGVSSLMAATAK